MITPTDIQYAQKLRALRINKNVKQEDAYLMLNLNSQQEYSKLENGKKSFTDELIEKISEAFNVSADEFISPIQNTNISNSPNSFNHSQNNIVNDSDFVGKLLKSKDETISSQNETIKQLKEMVELLKRK
jgi:transcriptional regulator with XRE-family HTH domain